MIFIDVDAAVELPVNVAPLTDDTDFKTIETGVAYNAAGMDLVWNFVTTAGVITQTAVTPTAAGDYDWSHIGDGMYKIEMPASGGAGINNNAEGTGYFTGSATGVLPWRSPDFVFRAAGINDKLIDSSYDATRGLAGTALPAAAADAAGGLPVSDAGGLDLDARLDAAISSRSSHAATDIVSGGAITTSSGAVVNVTTVATTITNSDMRGTDGANTTTPPTVAAIADGVWDETLADHLAAGSTGASLNTAGSAGDPWTTTLPGPYTGSQAGKILADILVDTGTTIPDTLDGLSVLDESAVTAAAEQALANYEVVTTTALTARTLLAADYATTANLQTVDDNVDAILADTNELQTKLIPMLVINGEGTEYQWTIDALENAPSGGGGEGSTDQTGFAY